MTDTTYNATTAKMSGKRADGYFKVGRNLTRCIESFGNGNRDFEIIKGVDESCLGKTESIDWWTETDSVFEAGAGGIITTANDLVCELDLPQARLIL